MSDITQRIAVSRRVEPHPTRHKAAAATRRMTRRVLLPIIPLFVILGLWEIIVKAGNISNLIIVAPSDICKSLIDTAPVLLTQAMPTLIDTFAGFALATIAGLILGSITVISPRLHQAIYPHLVIFQLIPKVALAPIFIIWLGVGPSSRLVFALFLAFFPVVIGTAAGLLSADRTAVRLCRSLGASRLQTLLAVQLPFATPHIFTSLKTSVSMAMIGVIVGEFITAQQGLGYIIMFASSVGETSLIFSAILILCVIGLLLYGLVVLAEALVVRRLGVTITSAEF